MKADPLVPFRPLAFAAASATIASSQQYTEEHNEDHRRVVRDRCQRPLVEAEPVRCDWLGGRGR